MGCCAIRSQIFMELLSPACVDNEGKHGRNEKIEGSGPGAEKELLQNDKNGCQDEDRNSDKRPPHVRAYQDE